MKVFISHKQEDASQAYDLAQVLRSLGVSYYLDTLDSTITGSGKQLTDHIKENLNTCTDIIVVMSELTKTSQWVPFEVGMSAQIDMPTATFLHYDLILPSFLSFWPRLKRPDDIKKYISTRNEIIPEFNTRSFNESISNRQSKTERFYSVLKSRLQ